MQLSDIVMNLATPKGFVHLIEWMSVLLMFMYCMYTFVLMRQIKLMNSSFTTPLALLFKTAARVLFLASVGAAFFGLITVL